MNRLWALILIALSLFWAGTAHASADSTCYPNWKIRQTRLSGCSSTALISPGNDTRVNLLMLLHDRHKAVGSTTLSSYNADGRRGEAEPFDYPIFALALGPRVKPSASDETVDVQLLWGTRCLSNIAGRAAFMGAVGAAKNIPAPERATLAAVRTTLNPDCIEGKTRSVVEQAVGLVKSKQGQNFARYLVGAAAFYDGDFVGARAAFGSIAKAESSWLADSAAYMTGRTALNQAMAGAFDEYGSVKEDGADTASLKSAEAAFLGYLKSYPQGEYAVSARGLLRRVYWLGKDRDRLVAEYVRQFASGDPASRSVSLVDLVQEMDVKILGELKPHAVSDPMLLAVLDLKAMRHDGDPKVADYDGPPITRAALAAQRARFAGNDALFGYVLAAHSFYVADDPADVLRLIRPASTSGGNGYLEYSRQLLRALALDATGDAGARATLVALVAAAKHPFQRGSAELALAMHDERAKRIDNVFAVNSVIRDADIREILLRYHASPALLRLRYNDKAAAGRERQVALYTLLYKQLTRGAYADFVRDQALIPADALPKPEDDYRAPLYTNIALFRWAGSQEFVCPSLKSVATTLAATPKDAGSLLCLGEFIRLSGLDPDYYGVVHYLDETPPTNELGGTPSLFAGKRFSRLDGYKAIIADPKSGADNKTYALYRAVQCFAPSGYNGCDATDVARDQRKAWFQRLKTDYSASTWAKKSKYYW